MCQLYKRAHRSKDGGSPSTCSGFFRLLIVLYLGTTLFRFISVTSLTNVTYHHCIFIFRHNAVIHSEAGQAAEYLPTQCLKCSFKNLMSFWYSFLCLKFFFSFFFFLCILLSLVFWNFTRKILWPKRSPKSDRRFKLRSIITKFQNAKYVMAYRERIIENKGMSIRMTPGSWQKALSTA